MHGFCDVRRTYGVRAIEIRNGARDAKHLVPCARREAERFSRRLQDPLPRPIERGDDGELACAKSRIAHGRFSPISVPRERHGARRFDASPHRARALADESRLSEVREIHGRKRDLQIDAIEEWPRETPPIRRDPLG